MPTVHRKPDLAAGAIKKIDLAANDGAVKISLDSKTSEALGKRLTKLAHSSPAQAFGLIVYLSELKDQGRLNFKDAGRIPSPGAAQSNAFGSLTNDAKNALHGNALISDDMKATLGAK